MDWNEIKIGFPVEYSEKAENIANMTVPYGFYLEDYSDLEQGAEEIAHINLIDEELLKKDRNTAIIHIYIDKQENLAESIQFIEERFKAEGIDCTVETDTVKDSDWQDNWKKFFKVTEIGDRLVIIPSWEKYDNKTGRAELKIDPGAAFGTGTHATTKMCLEMLEKYVKSGDSLLDIGCGSGILGIAAVLLGAQKSVGVDIDKTAIKVAGENSVENGIQNRTEFIEGDLCDKVSGKFNIVCANIVADAIINLSKTVCNYMNEDSLFICSGIIDIRAEETENALKNNGFCIIEHLTEDNWNAYCVRYVGGKND